METRRKRSEKQLSQRFAREVKARVNDYFEQNRLSRHANGAMISKTVVLVALYFGSYGLVVPGALPLLWMWFFCLVMGVGMPGSASRLLTMPCTAPIRPTRASTA
jgi:linoleoyl-CoA desaturase